MARHGVTRLDLDLLPLGDAVALLGALIGARVAAKPDAAAALAAQCTRLPLALRIAAAHAGGVVGRVAASSAAIRNANGNRVHLSLIHISEPTRPY